jgi:hypothetical protein
MACKLGYDRQCRVGRRRQNRPRSSMRTSCCMQVKLLPETNGLRELQRVRNIVRNDPEHA